MSDNMPVITKRDNCWRYSGDNFFVGDSFEEWDNKLRQIGAELQIVDSEMNERIIRQAT